MLVPKLIVAKGDKLDVFEVKGMALTGVDSVNGSRILVQRQKECSRVLIRVSLCLSTPYPRHYPFSTNPHISRLFYIWMFKCLPRLNDGIFLLV